MKEIELLSFLNKFDKLIICNGARPNWLSHFLGKKIDSFMKPYFDLDFEEAANEHDVGYWKGYTKKDKKRADIKFKKAMKLAIKRNGHSMFTRWFYYYKMYQYFLLVSYFGNSAFWWKFNRGFQDLPSNQSMFTDEVREKIGNTRCIWHSGKRRWYTRAEALDLGFIKEY